MDRLDRIEESIIRPPDVDRQEIFNPSEWEFIINDVFEEDGFITIVGLKGENDVSEMSNM